jgi:hypothetical protein
MSFVRSGNAGLPRRRFLGVLLSALAPLAWLAPGTAEAQQPQQPPPSMEIKQIKLTEKHILGFIAADKDMTQLRESMDPDKPDPKMEAQAAAVAKKNGFASLDEYDDVWRNVSMVFFGIDPQTKKFTEPPDQIRKEIEAVKADKSLSEAERKIELEELEAALKSAKPIRFRENIALVTKYFDRLLPVLQAPPRG